MRGPMTALCTELEERFGPAKVYNLHKPPIFWKRQVAVIGVTVDLGYMLELTFDGLTVRAGWWKGKPGRIENFRAAVDDEQLGAGLEDMLLALSSRAWRVAGALRARPIRLPKGPPTRSHPALP